MLEFVRALSTDRFLELVVLSLLLFVASVAGVLDEKAGLVHILPQKGRLSTVSYHKVSPPGGNKFFARLASGGGQLEKSVTVQHCIAYCRLVIV